MDYKNSGAGIKAGYASVELMKQYAKRTLRPEVIRGISGFSGAFSPAGIRNMEDPVLPSRIDDVDTKLKIASLLDRHDTIGIDCIAICVNGVVYASGGSLFFLDYIACGRSVPEKIATTVSDVAEDCAQAGCAPVGGETVEHPGSMPRDEYDFAGFLVGACDRKDLITGGELKPGNALISATSSGAHSNGFSLVRNIFEMNRKNLTRFYPELGAALDEALFTPTCIYVKVLKSAEGVSVRTHACSRITGGGSYENMPRILKDNVRVEIRRDPYEAPAIFRLMAEKGEVSEHITCNISNMGVGMVAAVDPADVEEIIEAFRAAGGRSFVIGECKMGEKGVDLC